MGFLGTGGAVLAGFFSLPELWYNFSVLAKGWDFLIIIVSVMISFVLSEVFAKNKDVRIWARDLFGVKIPLICLVLVREYYILYNVMNVDSAAASEILSGVSEIKNLMMVPYYNFCIIAKRWIPVVVVGCHAGGMVLYDVFKRNKEVQKWAVSWLIFAIPVFSLVMIYLLGILYGIVA